MKEPSGESFDVNSNEGELSFEEQVVLAEAIVRVAEDRDRFTENSGGIDAIEDIGASMSFTRQGYDRFAAAFEVARAEFDEKVTDKATFVKKLEEAGKTELAARIKRMFSL